MHRKIVFTALLVLWSTALFAQDSGLLTTYGDFVLRGTVLIQYRGNAEDLDIPANLGITEIGDGAFNQSNIRSLGIPEGVQRIGRAFDDCNSLTEIRLPSSLVSIGDYAFYNRQNLANINFPESLRSIGYWAFYGTGLGSVRIPAGVGMIGDCAFANGRNLTEINVDERNTAFSSSDGVLFNRERTALMQYPAGKQGRSFTIPEGIAAIRPGA